MADGNGAIGREQLMSRAAIPALIVLAVTALLVAGAFLALAASATTDGSVLAALRQGYLWSAIRFTILQAGLSTLLSVGLAIPVARAIARNSDWPGRRWLMLLLTVPLALPSLVAVFGIVTVWGRVGWLAMLTGLTPPIYGLTGILIAHVFFNLPFAVLLLTARLEAIPLETWRLAGQLGFRANSVWRLIEWPAIRSVLPGAAAIVFLVCVTSFTVILTLGGGPWATTLEVAIYQALRFDFDPPRAVLLALMQMVLCLIVITALRASGAAMLPMAGLGRPTERGGSLSGGQRLIDSVLIAGTVLFTGLPIVAVALAAAVNARALWADGWIVGRAIATSLGIAAVAASLSVAAAWSLVVAARGEDSFGRLAQKLASGGAVLLVVPPFVVGAGWFLLLNRQGLAFALAPVAVIAINALMSLPFALRILAAADEAAGRDLNRLCANLGLTGWLRFRLIDGPRLAPAVAFAAALAAALSLGDLGIAALFGSERLVTLPLLLQQRMGSYRQADAAALAGVLAGLCLLIFAAGEQFARRLRKGTAL